MPCSDHEALSAAHAEGTPDEAAAKQLESRQMGCTACRMALDETRGLIEHLEADGRDVPVPPIAIPVMDRIVRQQGFQLGRNISMRSIANTSVAAAVVGVGIALVALSPTLPGVRVYADDLTATRKGMERAKTATWEISYYEQLRGQDRRKSRWFRDANNHQRYYYKAPGLYRCEDLGADGKIVFVSVEDKVSRTILDVDHINKSARLSTTGVAFVSHYHPRGPFAKYLETMAREDLQSLGKGAVAGREANGFRYSYFSEPINRNYSIEFWIDAETKKLILCQDPGGDIFARAEIARDKAVAFPIPLETAVEYEGTKFFVNRDRGGQPGVTGHIIQGIAFDVDLDDSLFSLEPPEGYALKAVQPPRITEADVTEFMGIVAEYFGKAFPDHFPYFNHGGEDYLRFERVERDVLVTKTKTTPAETSMVEAMHKWWRTGIPGPGPMHVFIQQYITEGSWKYLGKGVKLGDKSRIVCWYRPKGSRTYRVIYGDLSIKDVVPEDLPMPVER